MATTYAPSLARTSLFVVVSGSEIDESIAIPQGTTVVGRRTACGIVLGDPSVSRVHASLLRSELSTTVTDLGSSNGTWLDGARLTEPARIHTGQEIAFGNVRLRYYETGTSSEETAEIPVPASRNGNGVPHLGARQRFVLTQLVQGATNREIADGLELSEATVKLEIRRLKRQLDADSRAQLALAATRLDLDQEA